MLVTLDNCALRITGVAPPLIRELDRRTAPLVEGHRFHPAFRKKFWDGREHLVKKARGVGYEAPAGLLGEVEALCKESGEPLSIKDNRRLPTSAIETTWNGDVFKLRPYQEEAAAAAIEERGFTTGKGLLRLATRSGKTVIAAQIIHLLKRRTLFLVQSEMLMAQTISLFERALGIECGQVGAGVWRPRGVTVASLQTLVKRTNDAASGDLLGSADVTFMDECHHINGEKWRERLMACDSYYKFGLSATISDFKNLDDNAPKGSIWLRAACGPILYDLPVSNLIRMGYLIQPELQLHVIAGSIEAGNFPMAYQRGIVEHEGRNSLIVSEAKRLVGEGLAVLVVTSRLDHVAVLERALTSSGLRVGAITGETPSASRRSLVGAYNARELDVLVGTVFGEGVDIPPINVVINAEGGKSEKATMQRFRNLTPANGKTTAIFVDFMDSHHKYLAKHSLARLRTYRENDAFKFKVLR